MLNEALEIVDARVLIACGHPGEVDVVRMFALIEAFTAHAMPMWAAEAAWCAEVACGIGDPDRPMN